MIKLFRTIRQKLLAGNKVKKYLLYAIGEIVLVVIGILIAIQLNELNEQRIERKEYAIVLENLAEEFGRTKELLTIISSGYVSSIDANLALLQLFSADLEDVSVQRIDTILGESFQQAPFYPPQPVLDELLDSGKIKSLPNSKLKQYIFEWESTIKWFYFDYDLSVNFSQFQLEPYITKNWSWKNIDIAGGSTFFEERSVLMVRKKELFRELEFENLVDTNLFHTDRLFKRLTGMSTLIDQILLEIDVSLRQQ